MENPNATQKLDPLVRPEAFPEVLAKVAAFVTTEKPQGQCAVCGFLEGDGSIVLDHGTAAIAFDRTWQVAQLDDILAITDEQMVELLYTLSDRPVLRRPNPGSDRMSHPLLALESQLLSHGYYAGRVVLRTAAHVLHWPEPPLTTVWRASILEHRTHPTGIRFRSMGATPHVQQLLRLEGLEPTNEVVDLCQEVFRRAFGDAIAEGMLANPHLAVPFE